MKVFPRDFPGRDTDTVPILYLIRFDRNRSQIMPVVRHLISTLGLVFFFLRALVFLYWNFFLKALHPFFRLFFLLRTSRIATGVDALRGQGNGN